MIYELRITNFMDDSFFECPWVWLVSVCVAGLVLLARCEEREPYDPYAWQGGQPDGAEAVAAYELEMLANSLPPCVE